MQALSSSVWQWLGHRAKLRSVGPENSSVSKCLCWVTRWISVDLMFYHRSMPCMPGQVVAPTAFSVLPYKCNLRASCYRMLCFSQLDVSSILADTTSYIERGVHWSHSTIPCRSSSRKLASILTKSPTINTTGLLAWLPGFLPVASRCCLKFINERPESSFCCWLTCFVLSDIVLLVTGRMVEPLIIHVIPPSRSLIIFVKVVSP